MQKLASILILSTLIAQFTTAQSDISGILMWKSVNSVFQNPALFPDNKVSVVLPHIYVGGATDNISIDDLLQKSPNDWLNNLSDQNRANVESNIQTAGVFLKLGKVSVGVHHGLRSNIYFKYPKSLLDLVWNGNAKYIGQTINIAPSLEALSVSEVALSLGYEYNKIKFGGRVKYLNGLANIKTTTNKLNLTTSDDVYQLTLDADYTLQSSSLLQWNSIDSINLSFDNFQYKQLFSKNNGLAFDLGASVQVGEKLTLAASINDLGSITWKENSKTYSTKGNYTYNGLSLDAAFKKDSTINFDNITDSLKNAFKIEEKDASYSQKMSAKYNLLANYQFNSKLGFTGGAWYQSVSEDIKLSSFMLGVNYSLFSWWKIGGSYVSYTGSPFNIGVSSLMKLGPIQMLLATDNIATFFKPQSSKFGNAKLGLAVVF